MPCHSPTKTRVIFSLTKAVPSAAMEMVSLKSATRQLRGWAEAVAASARSKDRTSSRCFVGHTRWGPGGGAGIGLGTILLILQEKQFVIRLARLLRSASHEHLQ